MTTVLRARWILPIDRPPIENGWIEVADGRIAAVGSGPAPSSARDLGDTAIMPGLVNAHTHLELSWLAGRVAPAASVVDWIRNLIALREAGPPGGDAERVNAMHRAAEAMRAAGTVLVGDISNTLTSPPALAATGLGGVVFHELLGFNIVDAGALVRDAWERVAKTSGTFLGSDQLKRTRDLVFSVVAHAPYSTSPSLFREIVRRRRDAPLAVHVGESHQEVEFLRTGGGPFRTLLEELGVWTTAWEVPRCDPIEFLDRLGYLRSGLLAVHAVQLTDGALGRLAAAGGAVVTCPRSNGWVGAGLPRVSHFYGAALPVAIGTDSLASSPSLSVFDELAELRRIAPDITAAALLDSATRQGARVLGFDAEFGTITAGRRAALIAVDIPDGAGDVEEYLVSGVPVTSVRHVV